MQNDSDIRLQCVKVARLRIDFDDKNMNLERWCEDDNNILCCRRGRVFIHEDGEKHVFSYPQSKWHNPFKSPKDGPLDVVIQKYENYVLENLKHDLHELEGKSLGCFCEMHKAGVQCHTMSLKRFAEIVLTQGVEALPEPHVIVECDLKNNDVHADDGQCSAVTKKGTRCSRKAKTNGMCTQHYKISNK